MSDRKAATRSAFAVLQSRTANKICVDCDTPNPQWASVSHGTLICIKCAGVHRSLGVHISFVRSVTMDSWSERQLAKMKAGGNKRLKEFLRMQKYPLNLDHQQKYGSVALEQYRSFIDSVSRGQQAELPSFIGYKGPATPKRKQPEEVARFGPAANSPHARNARGRGSNPPRRHMEGFGSEPMPQPNQDSDDFWSDVASAFSTAASNIADKSKTAATVIASKSKDAASALSEQSKSARQSIQEKEIGKKFADGASSGWSALSTFFQTAATSANTLIQGDEEGDGLQLYNKEAAVHSQPKYIKGSLSSDQYFSHSGPQNAPNGHNERPPQPELVQPSPPNAIREKVDVNKDNIDDLFADLQISESAEKPVAKNLAKTEANNKTSSKVAEDSWGWGISEDKDEESEAQQNDSWSFDDLDLLTEDVDVDEKSVKKENVKRENVKKENVKKENVKKEKGKDDLDLGEFHLSDDVENDWGWKD